MENKLKEDFSVPLIVSSPSPCLPKDENPIERPDQTVVLYAWKDILVLASGGFCFYFGYIAFLFNLSTLYDDANLVFISLSLNCGAQLLTSIFLPTLLVRRCGCKTTAVLAVSSVVAFSAAQFYPSFITFAPGSIILGCGNTCLWVAVGTYVSNVGLELAKAQNKRPDVVLSTLFGVVNFIRVSGAIAGNLVPFFLLSSPKQQETAGPLNKEDLAICGASYCSEPTHVWTPAVNQSLQEIEDQQMSGERTAVFAVFLGVGLLGPILLTLFLNPRRYLEESWDPTKTNVRQLLMATAYAMKDYKHLLLMCTFLTAGLLRAFASGDFTKGFVLCSIGLKEVSLSATISNICYVGGGFCASLLVRGIGVAGALTTTHTLCFITLSGLLIWTPYISWASSLLFIASAVMGIVMGAYNNLNNTSIGLLFPANKEEGYATFRFYFALGSTIGYASSVSVCMNIKMWTLLAVVTVAQATYMALEYVMRKNKHSSLETTKQ